MTPERLREWADAIEGEKPWAPKVSDIVDQLRAHAAALEELAKERSLCEYFANGSVTWQHRYEAALEQIERLKGERDVAVGMMNVALDQREQAERRAERLKFHAEAMADAIQFGDLAILTVAKAAAESYRAFDDGSPLTPHGEAIAAGDGTLHGAIDYWQQQAFTMAAGQCCVESGGLMADDHGNTYCDMERQRDELRGKLRVMANIMSDALDVIGTVQGDDSDEDVALMHLRAKMASATDSVKRADMKATK